VLDLERGSGAEKVETHPPTVLGRRPWLPAATPNGARAGEGEVTGGRWRCMSAVGAYMASERKRDDRRVDLIEGRRWGRWILENAGEMGIGVVNEWIWNT
jgi:hypothetical protein